MAKPCSPRPAALWPSLADKVAYFQTAPNIATPKNIESFRKNTKDLGAEFVKQHEALKVFVGTDDLDLDSP